MVSEPPAGEQLQLDFGSSSFAQEEGKGWVERPCAHCGKPVQVPAWYERCGMGLHFCGDSCREAWLKAMPLVEVTLDKRYRPRGANWEFQSRLARERDGYTCQVCGVTEKELGRQLDVHHRIPFRFFQSNIEANRLEHLVSVCPSCHARLEAQLRQELPLFCKP